MSKEHNEAIVEKLLKVFHEMAEKESIDFVFDQISKLLEENKYSVHIIKSFLRNFQYRGHHLERMYTDLIIYGYTLQRQIGGMQIRQRRVMRPAWIRDPNMSKPEVRAANKERKRLRKEGLVEEPKLGYVKEARRKGL